MQDGSFLPKDRLHKTSYTPGPKASGLGVMLNITLQRSTDATLYATKQRHNWSILVVVPAADLRADMSVYHAIQMGLDA